MTQPIGECYPFATQMAKEAVLRDYEDFKVVHGTIHDKWSGEVYQHAWVEWEGRAYDWQTKETQPDGIPLNVYYENFQPTDTISYTAAEAVRERSVVGIMDLGIIQ